MNAYLAGLLLSCTAFGQTGEELLHRMQQALGGAEGIAGIHDYDQIVHAQTWDRKGKPIRQVRKRTRWIRPDRLRLDQVGPGDTYALYFDGTFGWEILPGKRLADLSGGELEFARKYLSGFALNVWLADRNPAYHIASPARNVLRISEIDITLDPASWLPVKQNSISLADPAHPQASETQIKEWMTVERIKFPRRLWIFHDGVRLADITSEDIQLNRGLRPEDLARKPADLNPVLAGRYHGVRPP